MQRGRSRSGKKKPVPKIPREWFMLAPEEDLGFWLRVRAKVKSGGKRLRDMAAVQRIVRRLKHDK
jgi:hypothetical protein